MPVLHGASDVGLELRGGKPQAELARTRQRGHREHFQEMQMDVEKDTSRRSLSICRKCKELKKDVVYYCEREYGNATGMWLCNMKMLWNTYKLFSINKTLKMFYEELGLPKKDMCPYYAEHFMADCQKKRPMRHDKKTHEYMQALRSFQDGEDNAQHEVIK